MIKKLIRGIGVVLACLFLFPFSALAADKSVTLSEVEGGVQASIELPSEENENSVTSLQIGFLVEVIQGEAKQVNAEFHFDEAIKSSVKEYRYHEDTGILTIYLSGTENLFSEQKIKLGKITLATENPLGLKAKISVIKDSYKFVNEGDITVNTEMINAPGITDIVIGNGGVEEEPTPTPEAGEPTPTPEAGEPTPTPEAGKPIPTPETDNSTHTPGGQTVTPTLKPQGENPGNQSQSGVANTGDTMQPMFYLSVTVAAALILISLLAVQRRKRKQ